MCAKDSKKRDVQTKFLEMPLTVRTWVNDSSASIENILTWLRGFQDELLYLVVFCLYPDLLWEFREC